jgi:hypothetical protein
MGDSYDAYVGSMVESYRRAPWDWDDITDSVTKDGTKFWPPPEPVRYLRRINGGEIICVPTSEGESMTAFDINSRPAAALSTNYHSKIVLGQTYREEDTGFEGVAQAIYFYRNACERVELERYNKKLGLESLVFDAKRLSLVTPEGIKPLADSKAPGGPERGNPRRSTPNR